MEREHSASWSRSSHSSTSSRSRPRQRRRRGQSSQQSRPNAPPSVLPQSHTNLYFDGFQAQYSNGQDSSIAAWNAQSHFRIPMQLSQNALGFQAGTIYPAPGLALSPHQQSHGRSQYSSSSTDNGNLRTQSYASSSSADSQVYPGSSSRSTSSAASYQSGRSTQLTSRLHLVPESVLYS